MFPQKPRAASFLLLDEYFEAGDDRFLDELLACSAPLKLASVAEPLYRDPRPFARRALLAYVDDGCERPGHRPLVKALFKLAEAAGDDEAVGRFMVAFDRLARRRVVTHHRYDWRTARAWTETRLERSAEIPSGLVRADAEGRFTLRTRQYLARRALRYFRRLGHRDPARYGRAVREALARYEDAHLDKPEKLVDAWGLLHALYWGSPVLDRDPRGIRVAPGRALEELEPAPLHPAAWEGCFADLVELLASARSRTVRVWAIAWLERRYAGDLAAIPVRDLGWMLRSPHAELQALGARLLRSAPDLERVPAEAWLELLRTESLDVAPVVCELAARHLDPARLAFGECVDLALAGLAPVAELGFGWLGGREIRDEAELERALELRNAPVPAVRAGAAEWLAAFVERSPLARPEHARDLVDSRYADVRARALGLAEAGARFGDDLSLAAALAESPYDDARAHVVRRLGDWERAPQPGAPQPGAVRHVWAAAMLAVHRGGRLKRDVLDQLSDRLAASPGEAGELLPLLAVALRSVRPAERRAALAAVTRAALRAPELRGAIASALPELRLPELGPDMN